MTRVLNLGEVLLLDHMAGDHKPVGSARVSTGKRPEDSLRGDDSDRKLVHTLMSSGHGTPFEHAVFQFYVKAPVFVLREWMRHRMSSFNEQSGRYAKFKSEFYFPDHVRSQDPVNKQKSNRVDDEQLFARFEHVLTKSTFNAYDDYEALLESGVARELARLILPVNLYSSMWWTVNARSLMNFIALRNEPGAQWEIQEYARAIEGFFAEVMPWTYGEFQQIGRKAP